MQFNTYTYGGVHIAAWLVNNPEATTAELGAVLESYDVHQPLTTPAQMRAIRDWGTQLREVFQAATVAGKAERADALLVAAECRPRLISHAEGLPFHLHYTSVRAGLAGRVRALTAAGIAHLIDDEGGERLGICERDGCQVVFFDTSRNARRHFCSVRCANQVNVARHRHRHRLAAAS